MRTPLTRLAAALAVVLAMFVLAACGSKSNSGSSSTPASSSSSSSSGGGKYNAALPVDGQKKGGSMKFLSVESFEHLDPGIAYFQLDFMIDYAVHRSLYYYNPQDATKPVADIADGDPQVSADGKTVTVKIKPGIKYGTNDPSSSVNGKEVTAADIKYSLERGYNPNIASGYESAYFPIVGSKGAKGGPISGITTPDAHTLVLKLTSDFGATTAKALVMPITMPVPKAYAKKFDKENPSGFDAHPTQQAFTGPYMIKSYSAGKSIELVRNPEWDGAATGDVRKAYLDSMTWQLGSDPNVSGRQIFNGQGLANGDTPAAPIVKQFATKKPSQISFSPLGNRWVALNYGKKPFSDVNVRRAAAAMLNRTGMQKVRGGKLVGGVANHLLPPGLPGFDQAGGVAGTGADFLKNPNGDAAVAAAYMKKAGFPSGKANGEKITLVGDNSSPAKEDALIVQDSLTKLGFKVKTTLVEHSVFYSKYCTNTAALKKIDVCANFGWLPDFADPYAMLYVNFHGPGSAPFPAVNNNNPSLYNNPAVNAAMDKAATIADQTQRAAAWGAIDKSLTDDVAAIPWFWDNQANIVSSNVQGVVAKWNAAWDLSFMSLK